MCGEKMTREKSARAKMERIKVRDREKSARGKSSASMNKCDGKCRDFFIRIQLRLFQDLIGLLLFDSCDKVSRFCDTCWFPKSHGKKCDCENIRIFRHFIVSIIRQLLQF